MPMLPVVPEVQSHVLAEFDCLDPLLSALRLDSGRLKCTCLAVSRKWLALGTSAGGLHLIQREGWKQRLILTHKEGSITQVSCCPHDEDFIAVATSQGLVVVWELQLERRGRPERVSVSWEHRGQTLTSLCWDTAALRVFAGDKGGKVSFLRAGSSKLGKGSAFVIFPVQTITTVDSRVVQLGYLDGRLLVSSLSRCYLCDTEREKFWRVGNKERDGEYGACFFPLSRGVIVGQQPPPLLYCARPGSRVWEASFSGDVLSTHQFKQLLAVPPAPLISYRSEPHYNRAQKSSQSIAFPRLLYFGDQNLLTWTDSAIYVFTPQSGQVLLWTEVKDVVEIAVYRNELFCLRGDGRMSHLSLLSVERCVDRLLRREAWSLAATVCVMFQHAIAPSKARKSIPIDRLDHLRSQLSVTTHLDLIGQLEEVVAKLEPLDSASSSRRSSISSHESFNVLDCGIYRVISRRGSQSDEETSSLVSQSMLEEERLKEFSFVQEEEEQQGAEHGKRLVKVLLNNPPIPILTVLCVFFFLSVSSFVKKTTEKINTLQMNSDLWPRPPDPKDGSQGHVEAVATTVPFPEDGDHDSQIQDPLVLLDPACLKETLQEWIPVLERTEDDSPQQNGGQEDQREAQDHHRPDEASTEENLRVWSPKPLPPDLQAHLTQLATLYLELGYFGDPVVQKERGVVGVNAFLRRFFFLLDQERVRRMCLLGYGDQPEVHISFMEAMLELTQSSKVVEVIQKGDLLKSLRCLRELQPWSAPMLLAHLHRLYEKHGELAVRSFTQFYPTILPSDVTAMAKHSHFLAYLDNLVQSRAEEQRLSFLGSLLQPEALRQDWLGLALTHDAPQKSDTLTTDGQPRWHSHFFSWGYGRLLSLLIRLPADLASKQKMAETCRINGYWTGYVYLCCELQRRTEAFSTICRLDDMSLLEEPSGMVPQTMDEWKMLLQLSQQCSNSRPPSLTNGGSAADHIQTEVTPENLVLRLARAVGPDRAFEALQEVGMQSDMELGPHSTLVCELLRVAEKRQRWVMDHTRDYDTRYQGL
uniref:Hermansky-Pudlak syndrome 5 protein homolog n=1 Tax=Oncorhynchus mykiss TaxID=8022 RepID=A0A8C7LU25_ONCMY